MKAAWVMAGGSLGALARYTVSLVCARLFGADYPVGTLAANLAGCFLTGAVMGLTERSVDVTPTVRLFFVTGFLGAFTTFSTYAWESTSALGSGAVRLAAANVLATNVVGLALVMAGFWIVRR